MDGMVSVVSRRRRRRRWDMQDKVRIVTEAQEPGARVSEVAARHGVCRIVAKFPEWSCTEIAAD